MGLADKHDDRKFRHFAKMNADGSVASTLEVADGMADPVDESGSVFVDVTSAYPYDFAAAAMPQELLEDARTQALRVAEAVATDAAIAEANAKALPIDMVIVVDAPSVRQLSNEKDASLKTLSSLLIAQNAVPRG